MSITGNLVLSHITTHVTEYVIVLLLSVVGTGFVGYMDDRHIGSHKYGVDRLNDKIYSLKSKLFSVQLEKMRNRQFMDHSPTPNPARKFIADDLEKAEAQLKIELDEQYARLKTVKNLSK